jgi:outer membrane protein assembly factor BamB
MSRFSLALSVLTSVTVASAADWPTYRGDAARSGYTSEPLPARLSLAWTYKPLHAPAPAWPRDDRMLFDRAPDVAVAGGLVFFGSSVDGQIKAIDAATGQPQWTFFTGGPVRFAPTVWRERVFAVSDDGYLYCLAAKDGALVHRWRGGPSDQMILGNGRMVSRWPARGAPVIYGGVVYFAAGVWQSDGISIQAIDAESGQLLWRNDDAGKIYMPQPHGGAMADSGVSAQGYLVATPDTLLVPTGRAVPAAFSRSDGRFLYYHLQANGRSGGTLAVAIGSQFYNGGQAFRLATGELVAKLGAGAVAGLPGGLALSTPRELRVLEIGEKTVPDRKGAPTKVLDHKLLWSLPVEGGVSAIVAGETIIIGGDTKVTAIDARNRETTWSTEVDGTPYGLAVANGRLYVSTDRGTIDCYAAGPTEPVVIEEPRRKTAVDGKYAAAAEEIIQHSAIKEGYCLDLDCGDGSLAIALAQRSDLQIYALNPSAQEVEAIRLRLRDAGLYGARITVHQGDSSDVPYGKYFADLVVSSQSLADGPLAISAASPPAALRPGGGVACTGKLGAMQVFTRPALARSGSWTHQYSDPGNSSCSTDELVKGELHALWYRDVDLQMPQRHGRGHAPLFADGRMFVEGIDALRAVDAYNGRNLWEFKLPDVQQAYDADHLSGTAVTGSNFCYAGGSVYVHDKDRCYRLDAATGRKLGEFVSPKQRDGRPGQWGYIACDGELLYGSLANPQHKVRYAYVRADMSQLWGESNSLFALEAKSGELRWRYDAKDSIRNNAIALGNGRVFLIDRPIAEEDKWNPADKSTKLAPVTKVNQPLGTVVALDTATGKLLWRNEEAFGTVLSYSAAHDVLLMSYQATRFKLPSEIGGRLAAYRGQTGETLWDKKAVYTTRPLINDRTLYAQGGSWDLLTGEDQPFEFKRSYGCGQLAGSKHMLLFRSATLGYLDLSRGSGTENFGGLRPGCWINALPVGGLVLIPDASAGCTCSYQNKSWMALEGDE